MLDFIIRACKSPADYAGVLQWHKIEFVQSEEHTENVYSFIFKKPESLSWKAGQHGVFWFLGEKMKGGNWRAFSIASSSHENEIRISTIVPSENASLFKQKLASLQEGQTIYMQGPFGEFHASDKKQIVGVAGGIGITPFRAMLYEIAHGHISGTKLSLIYASENTYTFQHELEKWNNSTRAIDIVYTRTPDEVNGALLNQINVFGNIAYYFISGSPGMIGALRKNCKEKAIRKIVSDPFKGY